jgi:hypothetical protein
MHKFNIVFLALLAILAPIGLAKSSASLGVIADTDLNGLILTMQGTYYSNPSELLTSGVTNNSFVVYGSALKAGNGTDLNAYLAYTHAQLTAVFGKYVTSNNLANTTDYIILDMEKPVPPKQWGVELTEDEDDAGDQLEEIIAAYKLRITVARELLGPDAKICLYGVPVPPGPFSTSTKWTQQLAGIVKAGQLGAFDDVDYICANCYMRYCEQDYATYMSKIQTMTQLSVNAAKSFANSTGSQIPVIPLITPNVYNGNSKCDSDIVSAADLWQQITWIKALDIDTYIVWIGSATIPDTTSTIPQYLAQLLQAANAPQ